MVECYKRIKEAMSLRNKTQAELCEMTGIPKSAMSQYVSGKFVPKQTRIYLLAQALNVNEAWLMGYDVPMERTSASSENLTEKYPQLQPIPEMRKIPLVGAVACGEPIYREEDEWISLPNDIDADFCLRCVGDSMINARINDGDIVFIQACDIVENGQIAAVSIDNEVTLKRVYYYPEKNKLVLNPENPAYEPFVYTNEELNDIRILGKAVVFLSKVK